MRTLSLAWDPGRRSGLSADQVLAKQACGLGEISAFAEARIVPLRATGTTSPHCARRG